MYLIHPKLKLLSIDKLDQILQLRRVLSRGKVRESGSVAQEGQEEQVAQGGQGGQGLEPNSTHNAVGWKSGLADKKGKRCFLPYIYLHCTFHTAWMELESGW